MRTVFNVAQGLSEVLGPAWYHVLEVLQAVDRATRLAAAPSGAAAGAGAGADKAIVGTGGTLPDKPAVAPAYTLDSRGPLRCRMVKRVARRLTAAMGLLGLLGEVFRPRRQGWQGHDGAGPARSPDKNRGALLCALANVVPPPCLASLAA